MWTNLSKTRNIKFDYQYINLVLCSDIDDIGYHSNILYNTFTVGENIIATTKIRNNPIIQVSNIPIAILDFSLLPLLKLSPFFVSASFLMALFLKLSLFLTLKGDSEKITLTFH